MDKALARKHRSADSQWRQFIKRPQGNTDSRWKNEGGGSGRFDATHSCASLPNANEMSWYCMYGDPRWDAADELWTTMGHLYKSGMWFKKKAVLQTEGHYNSNTAVDGTDWRTNDNGNSWSVSQTLPSAADANNYFYLPALGLYNGDQQASVGDSGYYWLSSAHPWDSNRAYNLYFDNRFVSIVTNMCYSGYRVGGFE